LSVSTSVPKRSRPYHHGALRAALIAEALLVIAEHGEAALSLRDLARRLGVSHAAPQRHFPTLDALLAAIAEEGFGLLAATVEVAVPSSASPVDRLADAGWAYVRFALDHPNHFRVMFSGRLSQTQPSPPLQAVMSRAYSVLLGTIEAGQSAGQMADGDATELATAAWAQVHGLASLLIERRLGPPSASAAEPKVRRAIEVLITGIGNRPPGDD
jgi:AcrR family transcriptional regulator